MRNYYDTTSDQLQTEKLITMRGLPLDDAFLRGIGILPVEYPYPEHNADTHTLAPDGSPKLNADGTAYVQGFTIVDLPMEDARKNLKAKVTARRWEAETGGITLPDGTKVATTIDDQNRIASALQGMADAGIAEVDFKAESGWTRLSREQLAGVAALIAAHVQGCFSRERTLHEGIDAADSIEALTAIDINAGWPGQVPEVPDPAPAPEQAPGAA